VKEDRVAGLALGAQSARIRRVWYWRLANYYSFMALLLVLLVFLTVAGALTFGFGQLALILSGGELLAVAVLTAALSPVIMLRPDLVRIWHGLKFVNIGTNEVAGIGLLCTRSSGLRDDSHWRLYIWRADGTGEMTGYVYVYAPLRTRTRPNYDPMAASEIADLEASRGAAICRDLNQRLLAAQGTGGALATRRLEQHNRAVRLEPYNRVLGYWSPDGQTGRR
jgi:hypothetical protein